MGKTNTKILEKGEKEKEKTKGEEILKFFLRYITLNSFIS